MTMKRRTFLLSAAAACGGALRVSPARAQTAGATPLTIVIPFAAGGASDLLPRLLAEGLARELGRPVVVENKGGAGGLIAAGLVGRAAADGQTLLYGNQGQMVVARHLYPANGPEPRTVLMPLTLAARTQFFLLVPSSSPLSSATVLAGAGRAAPLKVGIPGIGSPPHLAMLLLGELTGAAIEPIPYQGSAPLLVDLIAGRLDAAFDNVATSHPHVRAGRLRALGVSGMKRAAVAPSVPTLAEAGIDGFAYQSWQGFFAPKGTPAEVTAGLVAALHKALADPAVRDRLAEVGLEVAVGTPLDFEALIARDAEEWDRRIRRGLVQPALTR